MTLKELKNKIAESEGSDWYLSYEVAVRYRHIHFNTVLKGVPAIYEFVLNQIEGFEKYKGLPGEIEDIKRRFKTVSENILNLIATKNRNPEAWRSNLHSMLSNSPLIFPINAPETLFLIKVYQETPAHFKGAFDYMSGNLGNLNNRDNWIGYMFAYEFMSKDFSQIVERKESEKKSIATIRADFQTKLGEAETHLTEYLANAKNKFDDYASEIDELKAQRDTMFSEWFMKINAGYIQFFDESNKKVKDLEDLYVEKLKLEAPAQYWHKRAVTLRSEGNRWLYGMIACLIVSVLILVFILDLIADGTLQQMFLKTSSAIKWSVAFITLISFLAYGIRTFAKLTFSSFHLARDAEEREQLTYVYLALKKEKQVDETERHLIMQSLFSRADSGLLRDDSGPTMPGQIADQMAKR